MKTPNEIRLLIDEAETDKEANRIIEEYGDQFKPKWIPTSERLPDKTSLVLIYGRYTRDCPNRVAEALFVKKGNNPKYWFFSISGIKSKDVTHWMPLTNPPEK